jgi:hypothetical protein
MRLLMNNHVFMMHQQTNASRHSSEYFVDYRVLHKYLQSSVGVNSLLILSIHEEYNTGDLKD